MLELSMDFFNKIHAKDFHYYTKSAASLTDKELRPISKKDFDNFIEYSEQRLIDAYSRMDMPNQPWASHTKEEVEFFTRYIPNDKNAVIFDIGCGTARHLAELKKIGFNNVYGFDFSDHLLQKAKELHPELDGHLFKKDARTLKHLKKADVIFCLYDVIGSFPLEKENLKIIKAARRNLKRGGIFICSVMNMELTENICKNRFDIYEDPKKLFRLKSSQTMQKTGNIFNPDAFVIDEKSKLVYRKEVFKGDGFLDSEYIIRDKRYTMPEIVGALKKQGFVILESRYVRAGKFDQPLRGTDLTAKEILVIAKKAAI